MCDSPIRSNLQNLWQVFGAMMVLRYSPILLWISTEARSPRVLCFKLIEGPDVKTSESSSLQLEWEESRNSSKFDLRPPMIVWWHRLSHNSKKKSNLEDVSATPKINVFTDRVQSDHEITATAVLISVNVLKLSHCAPSLTIYSLYK